MSAPASAPPRATRFGDVTLERGLEMAAPDGTVLRADLWRPAGSAGRRLPALLSRQPYGSVQAQALTYAHPATYARHGYAVVVQDVRGRWASDGPFEPYVHEASDGAAAVDWVASQPWCDGSVGMWGFSYAGATQLLAAGQRPDALKAIVPTHTGDDFADGWTFRRGGALEHAFVLPWAAFLAADTARRAGDGPGMAALLRMGDHPAELLDLLPLGDHPLLRRHAPWLSDWLAHEQPGDPYWAPARVRDVWDAIGVPALHVAGWFDSFLEGGLRNHAALRERGAVEQRLLVGPWGHIPWGRSVGAWAFGPSAGPGTVDRAQLRFLDRHLRDDGAGDGDAVLVMRGDGEWLDAWPPRTRAHTLWLHSAGAANGASGDGELRLSAPATAEPPDLAIADPAAPVPSAGGHSCCFEGAEPIGPADQAAVEALQRVLVYTSPPVAASTLIAGPVELVVFAQTDAPDGDVCAKLCLVDGHGRSYNALEGVARLRHAVAPGAAIAGEVHELRIALGTTCLRLHPGERLRLQVAASDFPRFDRNLQTGAPLGVGTIADAVVATQAVHHGADAPSRVELGVVEGGWA